jgi:AraC family transcriptional regulator of adaptative response / DNA-3-methyladenine glycosylase II
VHGNAVVALTPVADAVSCSLWLDDLADAQSAVQRCRRMLDLDCDPVTVDTQLEADPMLAPLVRKRPGMRSPGHPDGGELLVRAVLGQQVSVKGARTLAARLVASHGEELRTPRDGITHVFARPAAIAAIDARELAMPRARSAALVGACRELAEGRLDLDAGSDRARARAALEALPGIGPWTAGYVAMRALGDPDVFLPTDVGVRHAFTRLGLRASARDAQLLAQPWSPWRSYALHHLWASL